MSAFLYTNYNIKCYDINKYVLYKYRVIVCAYSISTTEYTYYKFIYYMCLKYFIYLVKRQA